MVSPGPGARYQALRELGKGAFGRVVSALDTELKRRVAVKLLENRVPSAAARERFEREARLTAGVRHPGLVQLFDFGCDPAGGAFLVYELVEGEDLGARLGRGELLPPMAAARLGARIAEALAALHAAGIVHRDLKPANVLLRPGGDPVVCDLGLARSLAEDDDLTETGALVGTPAYLAPEVVQGELAGPAADQFGLAAMLFHLTTGEKVVGAVDLADYLRRLHAGRFRPRFPPGYPWPVAAVLERALAPRPGDRYPDCTALGEALDEAAMLGSEARLPAPPAPAEAARRVTKTLALPREAKGVRAGTAPGKGRRLGRPPVAIAFALAAAAGLGALALREAPGGPSGGMVPVAGGPAAPGEASGRAAAAPGAGSEARDGEAARREVEAAARALGEPHGVAPGAMPELGGCMDGLAARAEAVIAPRTQLHWKRLLAAAEAWLAELPREPEDRDRFLLDWALLRLSFHHLLDLARLAEGHTDLVRRVMTRRPPVGSNLPAERVLEAHDDARQATEDFLVGPRDPLPDRALAVLLVDGALASETASPLVGELLPEVHRRLLERPEPFARTWLAYVHQALLSSNADRGVLPCPDRARFLVELVDAADGLVVDLPPPSGFRNLLPYVFPLVGMLGRCQESVDGRYRDGLDRFLVAMERWWPEDPETVGMFARMAVDSIGNMEVQAVFYGEPVAGPWKARLAQLGGRPKGR